ncbi:MAG: hypothetical protein JW843_07590 [Candidatus Aminicenantes bacterium]|nr:hypothetical protein [Candidatus Aminicenantes bacterium]
MAQERETALMLMDLWAFAYTQNPCRKSKNEFESACRLGDALALPEVKVFRELVYGLDRELVEMRAD